MCGIAGIWTSSSKEPLRPAAETMTAAMIHRGPDDGGLEIFSAGGGWLALGARRLAIQDISQAGHQPMYDSETGNWVVYNGEIYNFPALRVELEKRGVRFQSRTDTEVLLRGYAVWGARAIPRLRGMFAFALWDAVEKQLILCRDPMGVKPLYYAEIASTFLFASEVRALMASGLVPRQLCHQGLLDYLALGAVQDPHTMFEGVRALPAGHYAVWKEQKLGLHQYWSLRQCFQSSPEALPEPREIVDRVHATLATAVGLRLISDAPIGTFLSGGLDSSTVTALAAQQSTQPIRTVSVLFPEQAFSEQRYVEQVRRRYGTEHTEIRLSHQDFARLLPHAIQAMDQPTFDGVNTYVVSGQARNAGLKVALSGVGGDELFGGYSSFTRVPRLRMIRRWLPAPLRKPASAIICRLGRDTDRARKLSRWLEAGPGLDGNAEILCRELFGPIDRQRLAPGLPIFPIANGARDDELLDLDDFNAISFFELSYYLRNVLLRDTDVMGMAHGLEVREPLLDQHLVQLLAALPGRLKQNGGGHKALLVEAMRDALPQEILHRSKMGFTFPFARWLRGPLRKSLEETLLDPALGGPVAEVLDAAALRSVWERFLAGSASWVRPWSLYVAKIWGAQRF